MNRLTFEEPNGNFGVVGMNEGNKEAKLYACVCKLRDYELSGLSPDEVQRIQEDKLETLDKYMRNQLKEGKVICLPFRFNDREILFWKDGQANLLRCHDRQEADEYMAELLENNN